MFKTKCFLGALAVFSIFGFSSARAQSDDSALMMSLRQTLENLSAQVNSMTQTAQVVSPQPIQPPTLPYGTYSQTLYHNGNNWAAASNMTNSGGKVIISGASNNVSPLLYVNNGTISQSGLYTNNNHMASGLIVGGGTTINPQGVLFSVNASGMRLMNTGNAQLVRPTCNVVYRGVIWYTKGAVSDLISVCMLKASNIYAWKDL